MSFQMAEDHDSTLSDGFEYLDPPSSWPPLPSQAQLKEMAQRLQRALERDTGMGRAGDPVLRKGGGCLCDLKHSDPIWSRLAWSIRAGMVPS
jgi:hypothetical protein